MVSLKKLDNLAILALFLHSYNSPEVGDSSCLLFYMGHVLKLNALKFHSVSFIYFLAGPKVCKFDQCALQESKSILLRSLSPVIFVLAAMSKIKSTVSDSVPSVSVLASLPDLPKPLGLSSYTPSWPFILLIFLNHSSVSPLQIHPLCYTRGTVPTCHSSLWKLQNLSIAYKTKSETHILHRWPPALFI